jgi:hypothetical protein
MHMALVPDEDPRWGRLLNQRAGLYRLMGEIDVATRSARDAIERATRHGWAAVRRAATNELGLARLVAFDLDGAARAFDEVVAEVGEEDPLLGLALFGLGNIAMNRRQFDTARDLLVRAERVFRGAGDDGHAGDTMRARGLAEAQAGNRARARQLQFDALELYERIGLRYGMAESLNAIAEIDRAEGRLDAAERGYRAAAELYESVDASREAVQMNLGIMCMLRGDYAAARAPIEAARASLSRGDRPQLLAAALALLLPCLAAAREWVTWDVVFGDARIMLLRTGFLDPDVAWALEHAGDLCAKHGALDRARDAWKLAAEWWGALGDVARRDAALAKVG